MPRSRKTNRDHAKQKQRPIPEDDKGLATDPVTYFSANENQDLGIVKSQRKPNRKLIIAPFPDSTSRADGFFFDSSPQTLLTTAIAS
jgi:hypothetical protein